MKNNNDIDNFLEKIGHHAAVEEGFTRSEIEEQLDCGHTVAYRLIRAGLKRGIIEPVWVRKADSHGIKRAIKGYRKIQ